MKTAALSLSCLVSLVAALPEPQGSRGWQWGGFGAGNNNGNWWSNGWNWNNGDNSIAGLFGETVGSAVGTLIGCRVLGGIGCLVGGNIGGQIGGSLAGDGQEAGCNRRCNIDACKALTGSLRCQCENTLRLQCYAESEYRCPFPAVNVCGTQSPTAVDSAFPPCGAGGRSCRSDQTCKSILSSCTGASCQGVCIPKPPPTQPSGSGGATVYRYCQGDSSNCRSGEYCVKNPRSSCGSDCAQSTVCVKPQTTCGGSQGISCPRNQFCVEDTEYCFVSGDNDGECVGVCV